MMNPAVTRITPEVRMVGRALWRARERASVLSAPLRRRDRY